jgi:hypothetical protein
VRRRVRFLLRKKLISSYSSFFSLFRTFLSFSSCFDVAEFECVLHGAGGGGTVAGGGAGVLFFLGII